MDGVCVAREDTPRACASARSGTVNPALWLSSLASRPMTNRALTSLLSLAAVALLCAACGGKGGAAAPTTTVEGSSTTAPATTAAAGGSTSSTMQMQMSVILLAGVDRPDAPGGGDSSDSPQVTVPKSASKEWKASAWGPEGNDQMPSIPTGFTPVLVWDKVPGTGWSLQFQSAKKVDGKLVIRADRGIPGEGCETKPKAVGTTYLLGVDTKGVTSSTPVTLKVRKNTISCVG